MLLTPLLSGCGGAEDDAVQNDAAVVDASPADAAFCVDDAYGPGTAELPSARLPAGVHSLVACPGTEDWFGVGLAPGTDVHATVDAASAFSLTARGVDGALLATGGAVTFRIPLGGAVIGVGGRHNAAVAYTLTLREAASPGPCVADAAEPDDTPAAAVPLGAGRHGGRTVCAGDVDWISVEAAAAGERVGVAIEGSAVRAAAYVEVGGRLVRALEGAALDLVAWAPRQTIHVRIEGSDAEAEARYAVRVSKVPADARVARVAGRAFVPHRALGPDGLAPAVERPAAGLRVDVVRADTAVLVGLGLADETGAFAVDYAADGESDYDLRLVAAVDGAVAPVTVGPEVATPWAVVVRRLAVDGAHGVEASVAADEPVAAAFHVARTLAHGLGRVAEVAPAHPAPPLAVRWAPGTAAPCHTCFVPGSAPRIELSGLLRDPDEWDDAVVLHELGHYVLSVFSRDESPGGRHDGSPLPPPIAWSEGFATFHASWSLGTSAQLDARASGVSVLDLEMLDDARAHGTTDGTMSGDLSERLVAAVLWDLDDAADDVTDADAVELDDVFAPVFGALAEGDHDRGAAGPDFVDYLDGLRCTTDASGFAGIEALLVARDFPYDGAPACARHKSSSPLKISRKLDELLVEASASGRLVVWRGDERLVAMVAPGQVVRWRPPVSGPAFVGVSLEAPGRRDVEAFPWEPVKPRVLATQVRAGAVEAKWR